VVAAPDLEELDICDADAVVGALGRTHYELVINAAAYTSVDKAESEADRAAEVNARGAGIVARACAERGVPLLHVSTDYVFAGAATVPYREDDPIAPINVYGRTKADGEREVHAAGGIVVRTSWLFEEYGPSFVHTMLRLAAERPVLRVVDDQLGCPTWADDLADALFALARLDRHEPTYHFCNDGVTSWHGFATAIVEEARTHRSLACERIEPIPTSAYPTPAKRPAYSVLDTGRIRDAGITPPSWRVGMAHVVAQVLRQ
jgi:dTDP-4-dehydrorhamnose reductase